MRVISVILCLIISASVPAHAGSISTTAYAGSILWSSKHVITNLTKDQEWLLSATSEEVEDLEDDVEATASDMEDLKADPETDSVAFIDATLVMEGTEEAEATPLETLMDSTTLDEIQEDGAVGIGVEDATLDDGVETAAPEEDGVDEPEHPEEDGVKEDLVDEPIA